MPEAELGASRAYLYPSATSAAYINETEFRWIRARSRAFLTVNPYAAGAVRNRVAYTVGNGHTYNVVQRTPLAPQEARHLAERDEYATLSDCRAAIDEFCRANQWAKRQKETVRSPRPLDGERYLRFFPDAEAGLLRVRFVEPLEIQNPPGATAADGWFFGIRFARHAAGLDMETPVEYAIVHVNPLGAATELREKVPAAQIQRLTANVDLSSPRGLPVFFALQSHLNDAVRTLKATGRIVEFRARIGMIRRHVNATRDVVDEVLGKTSDGSRVKTARMYPYAAIIDTSDATDYQFPSETAPVDKNVAAIQAELRAAAASLGMPEYMLSGDASNANFASTMVAEGPAVKTFEEMQADLVAAVDCEVLEASAGRRRRGGQDPWSDCR